MLQVTRYWLVAFAATAMAVPTGIFLLAAAAFSVTLIHGEWLVVAVFTVLIAVFAVLTLARQRFCLLSAPLQLVASLCSIFLVILGYGLALSNVHSAA